MVIYIIEHLEPKVWPWCLIEYKNISKIVGKKNLWFTNVRTDTKTLKKLENLGKVSRRPVKTLDLKKACVLDPEAEEKLTPRGAKNFDYFIFGGILGDYPPKKRTRKEITSKIKHAKARNIGKKQFSTDNAVLVTKKILRGKPLSEIKFKDKLTIKINEIESIELPFCYPIIKGKAHISKDLVHFLKNKKTF